MELVRSTTLLDDVEPQPVLLRPRPSTGTKGFATREGEPLADRLLVGFPVWRAVRPGEDPAFNALDFKAEELAAYRFFLVHVTVTAYDDTNAPFTQINVGVPLSGSEQPDAVIAWSVAPDRMEDVVRLSREVSWQAGLKVRAIGLEAGPGLGWKRGAIVDQTRCSLVAGGELTARPGWRWRQTAATRIDGMLRLVLVVRAAIATTATGQLTISGTVTQRKFGVFAYDARLPKGDWPSFTLR
jgi:hypothetical protein